jgi:hypothetical protein
MTFEPDHDRLRRLLDLEDDALLVQLADDVAAGVGPLDPERKRGIARAWLDAQEDRLRDVVCNDPRVRQARAGQGDDLLTAAAIADLMSPLIGVPPAATVAVLLVRRGLDRLCG